jgi:hypothetical protein
LIGAGPTVIGGRALRCLAAYDLDHTLAVPVSVIREGPSFTFSGLPMKLLRPATIAISFAVVLISAIVSLDISAAQAPRTGMGNAQHAMEHPHHDGAAPAMQTGGGMNMKSDDPRELVSLPGPMRDHMLASMRDHLATLNTVIGDIADNKFEAASKRLEKRLGMSSLPLHHAAEMAPYFPKPMQNAGTNMHHAASRLAIALENASVARSFDAMRKVDAALHAVTSSCVACHAGYRVH